MPPADVDFPAIADLQRAARRALRGPRGARQAAKAASHEALLAIARKPCLRQGTKVDTLTALKRAGYPDLGELLRLIPKRIHDERTFRKAMKLERSIAAAMRARGRRELRKKAGFSGFPGPLEAFARSASTCIPAENTASATTPATPASA